MDRQSKVPGSIAAEILHNRSMDDIVDDGRKKSGGRPPNAKRTLPGQGRREGESVSKRAKSARVKNVVQMKGKRVKTGVETKADAAKAKTGKAKADAGKAKMVKVKKEKQGKKEKEKMHK
ncbi:MAG: hypothetical protein J3R72DRAFT_478030 [Linnemannia gamsii]|nr:MAG: hypothetical protein J3R72DRAFT_478030 [Linnemannia gamsii]